MSRTALTFLAGLIAVPMTPVTHTSPSGSPVARQATPIAYDATLKEAYLTPEALTYIRPGLNLKIVPVTNVAPGQHPVVEILMTDDLGGPSRTTRSTAMVAERCPSTRSRSPATAATARSATRASRPPKCRPAPRSMS